MTAMKTTAEDAQDAMSDTWITTKVKSLLLADSDAKGFDVKVETKDGIVILHGALESQEAIAHVKDIAAGVEGVKSVNTTAMTVSDKR
jgi:hyperosmotically inducible protein